jgi:hypothetical protein
MADQAPATYANLRSPLARRLFQSPIAGLASHWLVQSIFTMDRTERRFKLGLDLLLTPLLGLPLARRLRGPAPWLSAAVVAHTLNFLFNGQLWGVLKIYGLVRWEGARFATYTADLARRASAEPAISALIVYGSLSRGEWAPSSDLDGRILRRPGPVNGLRACAFLLGERSRALLAGFPLDLYVVDSPAALDRLRSDEGGIDLLAAEPDGFSSPSDGEP